MAFSLSRLPNACWVAYRVLLAKVFTPECVRLALTGVCKALSNPISNWHVVWFVTSRL